MHTFTRETFLENLREGLKNLYNFEYLRTSPLAKIFDIHDRFDTSRTLQKILVDSINAFKPPPEEPDQSRAWRIFDSLYCCYVQQLKQQLVADQLSISPRQLRREQRIAIESLADYLWDQYQLDSIRLSQRGHSNLENGPDLSKELSWIQDLHPSKPTILSQELEGVLEVIQPLCQQKNVELAVNVPVRLPPLAIHPVALSQILVNLLNAAINRALNGLVEVSADHDRLMVMIDIRVSKHGHTNPGLPIDQSLNVSTAHKLAQLSSIHLDITNDEGSDFQAKLQIPIQEQIPVLLVDDNKDALELFQRYTAGTRYRLITTANPNEILNLVNQVAPKIIVLDIMMPDTHGWKILGMIKNHPLTVNIPVIVCTILPQRDLALSLGANEFIKKPINRDKFLACLSQQNFEGTG